MNVICWLLKHDFYGKTYESRFIHRKTGKVYKRTFQICVRCGQVHPLGTHYERQATAEELETLKGLST